MLLLPAIAHVLQEPTRTETVQQVRMFVSLATLTVARAQGILLPALLATPISISTTQLVVLHVQLDILVIQMFGLACLAISIASG